MQNIENEEMKIKFLRLTRQMIYEWRFDELIHLINEKYPSFFNANQNIFYIIMKFNFIRIIIYQHDIQAAQDFYSKCLASIMKKIYGNKSSSYNKKHFKYQYFLNKINTTDKYIHFQEQFKSQIHLDKFVNLLEKSLQKGCISERNPVIFNVTKSDIKNNNLNKINNNNGKPLFKTEHVNILTYNNENMSEIEEELFKLNLGENKKNIFNVYSTENKNMNKNNLFINMTNSIDIDSNSNNNNEESNNLNYSDISNNNTYSEINNNRNEINRNKIDSKKFVEKNDFSSLDNKEKSNFSNKIRKVNLCKKIVRKFKKYLKLNNKEINYSFWNSFCRENYMPPFKLEDIEFKSFSRLYLNWLFSHEGGVELYNEFIRDKGEEEINNMYNSYGIIDIEEKKALKNFFKKFAIFFSNIKKNDNDNDNENNTNNKEFSAEKDFQADFASNFFENLIHKNEDNLSFGLANDFYNEERNSHIGREAKNLEVFNKMLISDSSNSSMENANFDFNMNNNNIDKNYENDKNNNDINNMDNYHDNTFFINSNNKKYINKNENNIYPDINYLEFNKNSSNINTSFHNNFFHNNGNDNIYNKKYEFFNEE